MKIRIKPLITGALATTAFAASLVFAGNIAGATGNTLVVDSDGMATSGNCNSTTVTPYTTINAAVTAASPGDTVKVCPGTYPEAVTVNQALALKGAKAGSNVGGRTAAGPNESTINNGTGADSPAITINAANVTVDGFSVTNPGHGLGIIVKTVGDNAVIKNNIIDGIGAPAYTPNTVGVYLELGPDNVKVTDNRISNVQSGPSAQGVLVGDSTSTNPSLGVVLDDNTISDITSTAKGAYGIQLNNGAFVTTLPRGYTTGKITDNTIKRLNATNIAGWVHAIGLEGDTPNIAIKNNTISDLTTPTASRIAAVWFESNLFFFTADVNQNSLNVGPASFGIAIEPTFTTLYPTLSVDGTCNWWGTKNGPGSVGPGSGSLVSVGVDFKPWLKSAKLNKGNCDNDQRDFNDSHSGHGSDDKDRWNVWDD